MCTSDLRPKAPGFKGQGEWVHWFNHHRLYEYCGDISPVDLEAAYCGSTPETSRRLSSHTGRSADSPAGESDGSRSCMGDDAAFPVGYYDLHPDVTLNFQLNRFWNWVGEPQMLDELRRVAPSLTNYDQWIRQLLALGENALGQGRMLAGAYLIRAAEFFMATDDPRRRGAPNLPGRRADPVRCGR
jgi:hypothetical protein